MDFDLFYDMHPLLSCGEIWGSRYVSNLRLRHHRPSTGRVKGKKVEEELNMTILSKKVEEMLKMTILSVLFFGFLAGFSTLLRAFLTRAGRPGSGFLNLFRSFLGRAPFLIPGLAKRSWATNPSHKYDIFDDSKCLFRSTNSASKMVPKMTFRAC